MISPHVDCDENEKMLKGKKSGEISNATDITRTSTIIMQHKNSAFDKYEKESYGQLAYPMTSKKIIIANRIVPRKIEHNFIGRIDHSIIKNNTKNLVISNEINGDDITPLSSRVYSYIPEMGREKKDFMQQFNSELIKIKPSVHYEEEKINANMNHSKLPNINKLIEERIHIKQIRRRQKVGLEKESNIETQFTFYDKESNKK